MQSASEVSFAETRILFGRYMIRQVIQQDDCETVYTAEDAQGNERCILRELTLNTAQFTEATRADCEQKLSTFLTLQHPQVQAIKSFHWEEDKLFIAQSLIEGQSYQKLLTLGTTLTELQLIQLLHQILPVLGYLHDRGIAHQNISPSSLIQRGEDTLPILCDFWVLQDVRTRLGIPCMESFVYHPNGQMPAEHLQAGVGNDLYLLGMTAIVLLTGQNLRVLHNPQTQSWDFQDWKLISDELAMVLNRMLVNPGYPPFTSSNEVLQYLPAFQAFHPPAPPTASSQPSGYVQATPSLNQQSYPIQPIEQLPVPCPSMVQLTPVSIQERQPTSSNRFWLLALGGGILLTLLGILAVLLTRELGKSQQPAVTIIQPNSNTPSPDRSPVVIGQPPITSPTPTPTITTPSPTITRFTEQDAVNLLDNWMKAKSRIFAYPFDTTLADAYTTGKIYDDIVRPEGSIDWLKKNNSYYQYGDHQIQPLGFFKASENSTQIDVRVTQAISFYENGRLKSSKTESGSYRFTFSLENGTWKISDRKSK